MNIRNPRVEALLDEVAYLTGEGTTEAGRRALEERRERLRATMGAEFPRTGCPLA
ncbi:MAG: type II toxin-antitoxin system VapB family antitoxin [Gemmatimonas sp.]